MTAASPSARSGRNPVARWVTDRRNSARARAAAGECGPERPATDFGMSVHDHGVCSLIEVTGELDIYTAPALRSALLDLIAAGRDRIVVDLGAVSFLDSSALGVLVGGYKRLTTTGGCLRIVRPAAGPISEVFRTVGLDRVLPLYDSAADAVGDTARTSSGQ
jgi:anti-sigma B factor antagonist